PLPYSVHRRHLHSFPTRRSSDLPEKRLGLAQEARAFEDYMRAAAAARRKDPERYPGLMTDVVQAVERGTAVMSEDEMAASFTIEDRKSTRLNSSHRTISYAVFCL